MRFRFINNHSYEDFIKGAIEVLQKHLKKRQNDESVKNRGRSIQNDLRTHATTR